jgi:hypothetical protein
MQRFWLPLAVATMLAAPVLLMPKAGHAEPYKWCAVYSGGRGGGARNCGFVSWEQCMQTVRGMGGFCEINLFYTGPEERPVKHRRKRHDD